LIVRGVTPRVALLSKEKKKGGNRGGKKQGRESSKKGKRKKEDYAPSLERLRQPVHGRGGWGAGPEGVSGWEENHARSWSRCGTRGGGGRQGGRKGGRLESKKKLRCSRSDGEKTEKGKRGDLAGGKITKEGREPK